VRNGRRFDGCVDIRFARIDHLEEHEQGQRYNHDLDEPWHNDAQRATAISAPPTRRGGGVPPSDQRARDHLIRPRN
jgi:hypothetical protein